MRISDWSSDVCSSDLACRSTDLRSLEGKSGPPASSGRTPFCGGSSSLRLCVRRGWGPAVRSHPYCSNAAEDRKSVVSGKSVSVRVDLGGRRIIKKTTETMTHNECNHAKK